MKISYAASIYAAHSRSTILWILDMLRVYVLPWVVTLFDQQFHPSVPLVSVHAREITLGTRTTTVMVRQQTEVVRKTSCANDHNAERHSQPAAC